MARPERETKQLPAEALQALGLTTVVRSKVSKLNFPVGKVQQVDIPLGSVWVKVHETPNIRKRQKWVRAALNLLPAAALSQTIGGDVSNSLLRQAEQAEILREAGFNIPKTLFVNQDFHITSDVGPTLSDLLSRLKHNGLLNDPANSDHRLFNEILLAATKELARLHKAGFAHGRPKLRDFSWSGNFKAQGDSNVQIDNGKISLFDLDERPWEEMAMTDAQGRDVMLWMLDICQLKVPLETATKVCQLLLSNASKDVIESVKKTNRALAPISPIAGLLLKLGVRSRELQGGFEAHKILKHYFSTTPNSV